MYFEIFLVFVLAGIKTGTVTMNYFDGDSCDFENWVYSFKIGETTSTCEPMKFYAQHFYGKTSCNITEGIFTTSHYNDSECNDHKYDRHTKIDPICTKDKENPWMLSHGDCDFQIPTESAHVLVYPSTTCSLPVGQYMEQYIRTNKCFGYNNPPEKVGGSKTFDAVNSAVLDCDSDGAVLKTYKDGFCKELITELPLPSEKCVSNTDEMPDIAFKLVSGC